MYNKDMKILIKYAIELDITELKTFRGYKGGDILAFKTEEESVLKLIKSFCHKMEVDVDVKKDKRVYELFCQFGVDRYKMPDDDEIYTIKN